MKQHTVLILHWLPDGELAPRVNAFPECDFLDGRTPEAAERHLPEATMVYGLPDVQRLCDAKKLHRIHWHRRGCRSRSADPLRSARCR